jgi:hypothetical protein
VALWFLNRLARVPQSTAASRPSGILSRNARHQDRASATMLRFDVARLLDDPQLEIFTFFPDYCTEKMPNSADCYFTIYVVRDGDEIFYVGRSEDDCFTRLRTHLGHKFRGHQSLSTLGGFIMRNLPESRHWTVELYTMRTRSA